MFAMTLSMGLQPRMTMRIGLLDGLIHELETTPSARERVKLIRKLALSHMTEVIDTITPFLAGEPRVRRASVAALVSFGEDARGPMLEILGASHRRELHRGAVEVLAGLVIAAAAEAGVP